MRYLARLWVQSSANIHWSLLPPASVTPPFSLQDIEEKTPQTQHTRTLQVFLYFKSMTNFRKPLSFSPQCINDVKQLPSNLYPVHLWNSLAACFKNAALLYYSACDSSWPPTEILLGIAVRFISLLSQSNNTFRIVGSCSTSLLSLKQLSLFIIYKHFAILVIQWWACSTWSSGHSYLTLERVVTFNQCIIALIHECRLCTKCLVEHCLSVLILDYQ